MRRTGSRTRRTCISVTSNAGLSRTDLVKTVDTNLHADTEWLG